MTQTMCIRMFKSFMPAALLAVSLCASRAAAQGSGGPLTTEGLHQQANHSAAARAFGAVTIGDQGNAGLMFLNPAAMHGLDGIHVSIGGLRQYRDIEQVQHFAPVRYYPNLSLLLEGMTDGIPDPDPELVGFTPADSVQRPFDDIRPPWSRSLDSSMPLHAVIAAPFSLGGLRLTAGLGAVQYADLNHYYQNNNVLNPEVLATRPLPIRRPTDDHPITADWYQSIRSRDGSIRGYGAAMAAHIERYGITIGVSGMILDGESDDFEQRVERGTLTFLANEFRADSNVGRVTKTGTSEFSGQEFAISSTLHGRFATIGFVVKPPTTYTRSFETTIESDTTGTPASSTISGEDELQLPWRGSVGLLLTPREKLRIGLQFELRPYASATFTSASGDDSTPWHSASLFRIGAEYRLASWLILRGGIRGEADVFVPDGSALTEDPAGYRVYSGGLGFAFSGVRWNVTYEHARMKYEDVWGSALSRNLDERHTIVTDISITLPTGR